jgi:hypothetical protein
VRFDAYIESKIRERASNVTNYPFTTLNAGLPFATLREDFNPHDQTLNINVNLVNFKQI